MLQETALSIFLQSRPSLPSALPARIMVAIEQEATRKLQFRERVASAFSFLSLVLFFVSLAFVGNSLIASDFWQLAALFFSDLSLVLAHFETFLFSLAETFPAASFALLLLPLFFHLAALVLRSWYMDTRSAVRPFQFKASH